MWWGLVLAGLGAFWAWFFALHAALYVPMCQGGEGWSSAIELCRTLRLRIVAMWCVAALGVAILGWGVVRWWVRRRGSSTAPTPD